jgi:hypothetical protein
VSLGMGAVLFVLGAVCLAAPAHADFIPSLSSSGATGAYVPASVNTLSEAILFEDILAWFHRKFRKSHMLPQKTAAVPTAQQLPQLEPGPSSGPSAVLGSLTSTDSGGTVTPLFSLSNSIVSNQFSAASLLTEVGTSGTVSSQISVGPASDLLGTGVTNSRILASSPASDAFNLTGNKSGTMAPLPQSLTLGLVGACTLLALAWARRRAVMAHCKR